VTVSAGSLAIANGRRGLGFHPRSRRRRRHHGQSGR
jgi:hypothetical protein